MESFVSGRLVLTKCLLCHLSSHSHSACVGVKFVCPSEAVHLPTAVASHTEQSKVTRVRLELEN